MSADAPAVATGNAGGAELVEIDALYKNYRVGFLARRVEAVRGVSFRVREGEIVGLVGPNGAGKTTTLKVLLGLCAPTAGAARIRGIDAREPRAREGLGFLPENPYVYPYLTPREFVDLCARLSGMRSTSGSDRRKRVERALERTGVAHAMDRPVRSMSKGMLQRTGLAAALVAQPELLVLDEPMSGLDPLGRREVRDLIFEERSAGRTVLFSSHVLSDVEALCDRVVILRAGKVVVEGAITELMRSSKMLVEVVLRNVAPEHSPELAALGRVLRSFGEEVALEVEGDDRLHTLLRFALDHQARVVSVVPRKDSLEDLFLREAVGRTDKNA